MPRRRAGKVSLYFPIPSNGAEPLRQTGQEKARAGVARELGTGTNTNRACLLHLGHTIQCRGALR